MEEIDPLRGLEAGEYLWRSLSTAPIATIIVAIVGVGAVGGYWLYRKGRQDEREGFRAYLESMREFFNRRD